MAPKDLGKGIAPKDLGKGIGGKQKSSHSRAGLGKGGAIELWRALGKVEPSHDIAPQSLRTALLSLLARTPELNSGGYTGQVWASLNNKKG